MRLKEKVAVVTGAGSGMGKSIAIKFAQEGARVIVVDVSEDGEKTVALIREAGHDATFFKTDISSAPELKKLFELVDHDFGQLDVLVNCAGIFSKQAPVELADETEFEKVYSVNVRGIFLGCKYAVPLMKRKGSGSIINIASSVGYNPVPENVAYVSSKGAVIALSKTLAKELIKYKIRVNHINPGLTDTPMLDQFPQEVKANIAQSIPMGRIIKPEDVANTALFLASDESEMVTNTGVNVDGGLGMM